MRKTLPFTVAVGLTCALMIGCNRQAGQAAGASHLDQAVRIVNTANRGYIPVDPDASTGKAKKTEQGDLAQYRQDRLQEAAQALKKARESGGKDQRQMATRLLSQVQASRARHQLNQAMGAFADVRSRGSDLLSQLDAAHRAASEVRNYNRDPEALAGRLQQQIQKEQKARHQLQQQIQRLQAKLNQAQGKAKNLHQKSNQMAQKAQGLRSKAFVAGGDKQYDLYDKASKAQSAGASASFDAERQGVVVENLQQQLKPLQARLDSVNQAIKQLHAQIKATRQDAAAAQQKLEKSRQRQSDALGALTDSFKTLVDRFDKSVRQPLAKARDRMDQAVTMLDKLPGREPGVRMDLLNRRVQQSTLLTQRAIALSGFAATLDSVRQGASGLGSAAAQQFAKTQQEIAKAADQAVKAANQAIQAGQNLGQELSSGRSSDQAKSLAGQLSDLHQQLQQAAASKGE